MELQLKQFQSFQPPILRGTETADDCKNWLDDIEVLFDSLDYQDERRIKLVPNQLQEIARRSYREDKRVEFENLKQGQLNIEEYVAKFSTLLRFAPLIGGNDEAVADQFINGLNPEIFALMKVERPHHFADVLNKANRVEYGRQIYCLGDITFEDDIAVDLNNVENVIG
ncbi:uncharacterized protein [Primulina huaijiensis]|uniref:uncharacterized protein n=1 Tax=Primulina huaijiensis TaxID=1492673 RepID=UPI003CC74F54